jgi:hypothetical protein
MPSNPAVFRSDSISLTGLIGGPIGKKAFAIFSRMAILPPGLINRRNSWDCSLVREFVIDKTEKDQVKVIAWQRDMGPVALDGCHIHSGFLCIVRSLSEHLWLEINGDSLASGLGERYRVESRSTAKVHDAPILQNPEKFYNLARGAIEEPSQRVVEFPRMRTLKHMMLLVGQ